MRTRSNGVLIMKRFLGCTRDQYQNCSLNKRLRECMAQYQQLTHRNVALQLSKLSYAPILKLNTEEVRHTSTCADLSRSKRPRKHCDPTVISSRRGDAAAATFAAACTPFASCWFMRLPRTTVVITGWKLLNQALKGALELTTHVGYQQRIHKAENVHVAGTRKLCIWLWRAEE